MTTTTHANGATEAHRYTENAGAFTPVTDECPHKQAHLDIIAQVLLTNLLQDSRLQANATTINNLATNGRVIYSLEKDTLGVYDINEKIESIHFKRADLDATTQGACSLAYNAAMRTNEICTGCLPPQPVETAETSTQTNPD